jgi:hypothetical protein
MARSLMVSSASYCINFFACSPTTNLRLRVIILQGVLKHDAEVAGTVLQRAILAVMDALENALHINGLRM